MARPAHDNDEARHLVWTSLRETPDGLTRKALADLHQVAPSTVANYLNALLAGGYVEKIEAARGAPVWRLIRDTGFHAPRLRADGSAVTTGNATRNMWRSMRILKQFSARELSATATTTDTEVTEVHARVYCHKLLQAGYLRVIKKARPPHVAAVYRLARNTGPQPPKVQRVQQVFDPNTKRVHALGGQK